MQKKQDYRGKLLIANPLLSDSGVSESVFMVVDQVKTNLTTICINKPYQNGSSFNNVMLSLGLSSDYSDVPLYFGGIEAQNRVFVIHSMDWAGLTTVQLSDDIGFTTDLSILTAISSNQGPEYFKPCTGFNRWNRTELEEDIENSKFSVVQSNIEICFESDDDELWKNSLFIAAKQQVSQWF